MKGYFDCPPPRLSLIVEPQPSAGYHIRSINNNYSRAVGYINQVMLQSKGVELKFFRSI